MHGVMVGVLYKKRALPIAWVVYKGKKGHTTAERHIQALEKVQALLPEGKEVILLGDAEYDTTEMLFGCKKTQTGTMFYALLHKSTCKKGKSASRLKPIPCKKGRLCCIARSALPRMRRFPST